jgi:glycosyl hydrolase family 43
MTAQSPFFRPLFPEDRDQGDPYVFTAPPGSGARFAYYVYVTGEEAAADRAFPAYGSDDLITWHPLGAVLEADTSKAHWAPCVSYVPGAERPFVMLYSRGIGQGEQGHIGHAIRRADADTPEGPYVDSGHVLTPDLDFAIDPDVYRRPDGRLHLAFAMDFTDVPPLGTGIVEAPIADDLTRLLAPPQLLARASHAWHVYDPVRKLPWKTITGVNWETDSVRWHTVEAPVGGLMSPAGREVYLYSGGCFFAYYAVGALARDEAGILTDVSQDEQRIVLGPHVERRLFAPGHCSYLRLEDGSSLGDGSPTNEYLMFHARFGSPDSPRQMALTPLHWTPEGLPSTQPTTPRAVR